MCVGLCVHTCTYRCECDETVLLLTRLLFSVHSFHLYWFILLFLCLLKYFFHSIVVISSRHNDYFTPSFNSHYFRRLSLLHYFQHSLAPQFQTFQILDLTRDTTLYHFPPTTSLPLHLTTTHNVLITPLNTTSPSS